MDIVPTFAETYAQLKQQGYEVITVDDICNNSSLSRDEALSAADDDNIAINRDIVTYCEQ